MADSKVKWDEFKLTELEKDMIAPAEIIFLPDEPYPRNNSVTITALIRYKDYRIQSVFSKELINGINNPRVYVIQALLKAREEMFMFAWKIEDHVENGQ